MYIYIYILFVRVRIKMFFILFYYARVRIRKREGYNLLLCTFENIYCFLYTKNICKTHLKKVRVICWSQNKFHCMCLSCMVLHIGENSPTILVSTCKNYISHVFLHLIVIYTECEFLKFFFFCQTKEDKWTFDTLKSNSKVTNIQNLIPKYWFLLDIFLIFYYY